MEITITIKIDDQELLNSKNEKKQKDVANNVSSYARVFDKDCDMWEPIHEYNRVFLATQQLKANALLKNRGYLFLNEVYEMLGVPKSKAGQIVGWVYDEKNPNGDNYVDFGIYDDRNKDFVNGNKKTALLDFNVDGNILEIL